MNNLGVHCLSGTGVKKDVIASTKWFLKAAEEDHTLALYNLARAYQFGWGISSDMKKSLDCFTRAAAAGHEPSAKELVMLRKTLGEDWVP